MSESVAKKCFLLFWLRVSLAEIEVFPVEVPVAGYL